VAGVLGARAVDRFDQCRARDLLAVAALRRVDQRIGSAAELGRSFVEKSEPPIGNRRPASSTIACRFFFRPAG